MSQVVFVLVAIFGNGDALKQSVGALAAVVAVMVADMLCHPYVKEMYDVLEEWLAFVEFMVLLLGLVALVEPEPGGWHEITAWLMMMGAFILIAYVAVTDLEGVWQMRRMNALRKRHKITLSPALFQLDAFDAVLIDWLAQVQPEAVYSFGQLVGQLNRARYGGALKRTSRTVQYEEQLKVLPFLLDNICGNPDGSLPIEVSTDMETMTELLGHYLRAVSIPPDNHSGLPAHCFFQQPVRGALTCWLAKPEQVELRVRMYAFLRDIGAYAKARVARLSSGGRIKKMLLPAATDRNILQAQRQAVAEAEKARKRQPKAKPSSTSSTADVASDTESRRSAPIGSSLQRSSAMAHMINLIDPLTEQMQKATAGILVRLIMQLRCELVEVVPAADATAPLLIAAQVLHPHVQSKRRKNAGTSWSKDPSSPLGLCALNQETVYVDCALRDSRFSLPYAVGEISHIYVPILEYRRWRVSDVVRAATMQKGNSEVQKNDAPRLLGVLRCANKFSDTSSRAGYAFTSDDERCTKQFASLVAELAADGARMVEEVKKVQRAVRRRATKGVPTSLPKPAGKSGGGDVSRLHV